MQSFLSQNIHPPSSPFPCGDLPPVPLAGTLASLLLARMVGGDGPHRSSRRARSAGKHDVEKPKILVVDDERVIADTMAEILNDSGFEATAAYNAKTAMSAIQKDCPDIVLTDVIMPGMNGIELAKYVADTCSDTKILLLSGQASVSDLLRQARELGYSFELLAKPLHPDQLIEKLRG
jgi:CheY-like chemotaxis protein